MKENIREYYIDWLRIIVVALLVPYHIAATFSHIGNVYIYIPVKDNSLYFFIHSFFLNLWFMRLLFFVSGISTYYALKKRTHKEYFLERSKRLLLPTIFAMIIICPVMAYFRALNLYNFNGSLLSFYPTFFVHMEKYLGWGHFWFLIYLFVYSMILLILRKLLKNKTAYIEKLNMFLIKKKNIILPIFVIIFFEMVFRPFYPGWQNLVNDWANFTVYLSFFILGYVIAHSSECINKIVMHIRLFSVIGIISTVCFIFLKYAQNNIEPFIGYYINTTYEYNITLAFLQGVAEYSLVLLIFGIAKKILNLNNKIYKYLSKTSFSLYMFHFILVNITVYYLIKTPLNHHVMYILAIGIVYISFIIFFELIIKRIFFLRYICGIKKHSKEEKI